MITGKGTSHPSKRESRPAVTERLPICQLGGDSNEDSNGRGERQSPTPPFCTSRDAALALLTADTRLTRRAGAFLGQTAVDATPLTPAQRDWLDTLLDRADLPPLMDGGTGMKARVLGIEHWRAAKHRRVVREQQARRRFYEGPPPPVRRPTLDEIMGPWSAPRGGGDAA